MPSDDEEFFCGMCNGQDAIFGMEEGTGEELGASSEGEQPVTAVPLPTPFQPTISQFMNHCITLPVPVVVPVLR